MNQSQESKKKQCSNPLGDMFSKCHKDFIEICPTCGEEIYHTYNTDHSIDFYTMCECKEKAYELAAIEQLKNNKKAIIESNKSKCGFSKRDIAEVPTKIKTHKGNIKAYDTLIKYANSFSKEMKTGFYIYGDTGVGKSLLAKKVMTIVLNNCFSAYITNVSKLMNDIKKENATFSKDTLNKCMEVDLLVLDDLGTERGTEYDVEQLFLILETRWREYRPIMFTSNIEPKELEMKYNDKGRLYSRIMGTCIELKIEDKDHRVDGVEL